MRTLMDTVRLGLAANNGQGTTGNNHVARFQRREQPQPGNKRRRSVNDDGETIVVHTADVHTAENSADEDVFNEEVPVKKDSWATVANKSKPRKPSIRKQSNWRTKNLILHGSAEDNSGDSNENSLAADVSLVAFGVAKDASTEKLKGYLEKKGLKVVNCELLTKHVNEARTHSYKVTVKASEFEKA